MQRAQEAAIVSCIIAIMSCMTMQRHLQQRCLHSAAAAQQWLLGLEPQT